MDWQQIVSLTIVILTVALLVRSFVRKRNRSTFGFCEDDCGCSATDLVKQIPPERLKQLRQQQRRQSPHGAARN